MYLVNCHRSYAKEAGTNPVVISRRAELRERYEFDDDEFDRLFASYNLSLRVFAKDSNWNDEIESHARDAGCNEERINQARTDLIEAVLQRIDVRFFMEERIRSGS